MPIIVDHNGVTLYGSLIIQNVQVTTLKTRFNGDVLPKECDPATHFICQVIKYNDLIFKMPNIYGYKTKIENANLIFSMENILEGW